MDERRKKVPNLLFLLSSSCEVAWSHFPLCDTVPSSLTLVFLKHLLLLYHSANQQHLYYQTQFFSLFFIPIILQRFHCLIINNHSTPSLAVFSSFSSSSSCNFYHKSQCTPFFSTPPFGSESLVSHPHWWNSSKPSWVFTYSS